MAFAVVSCQRDKTSDIVTNDDVAVTLAIDVPELGASRSGESGMDSALGAIDNFDAAGLWDKFDLRYIIEVYEVTDGFENYTSPILDRTVQVLDKYESTTFKTRLVPNRDYRFVIWADFVADGSYLAEDPLTVADLNYNTTDLKNITPTEWSAMDECRDAYFIAKTLHLENTLTTSMTLTRPFGKLRVITTDIESLNIGTVPYNVTVTYYNHPIFDSLNAVTGNLNTTTKDLTYTYTVNKETPYNKGYDALTTHQTLFVDYLYAVDDQTELNFRMDVSEENGRPIKSLDFCTQIPLQRNHLTTIIGNMLTIATQVNISIDDNFTNTEDDEDWIVNIPDQE